MICSPHSAIPALQFATSRNWGGPKMELHRRTSRTAAVAFAVKVAQVCALVAADGLEVLAVELAVVAAPRPESVIIVVPATLLALVACM